MNFRAAFLFFPSLLFFGLSMGQDRDQDRTQEQPPRFQIGVNFVQVDVVVTDQGGHPVMDLTAKDFEILEEDEVQVVASFRVVDFVGEGQDVSPPVSEVSDIGTNRLSRETRYYVLVLDGLHTSPGLTGRARRIARKFVAEHVGREDLAAVLVTGGAQTAQSFTNNQALLIESIDKFQGQRLLSPYLKEAQQNTERQGRRNPFTQALPLGSGNSLSLEERAIRGRYLLQTLRAIAERLSEIEGLRKAIVLIGEGIDFDLYGLSATNPIGPSMLAETLRTGGELARSNIAIYCIDPSGLSRGDWGGAETRQVVSPTALHAERHQRQDNLHILSGETGGAAFLNQNDYETGLRQVVEDTSRYYLLGYYPANQEEDGKYRRIQVQVKRPGLTVRARKGYVAGSPERAEETGTEAEEDLFNAMEIWESPLRVTAGALDLRGRKAMVPIVVEVGIEGFRFTDEHETLRDRIELTAIALDRQGQTVASQGRMLDISVSPRVRDLMLQHGFRAMTSLDLPPGAYQLRVRVREEGAGKRGTVFLDLEIPDCRGSSLAMGGVFMGSLRQTHIPLAIEPEDKREFAFAPSTRRKFTPLDELLVQTEVCWAGEAVVVETDVRMAAGDLLFRDVRSYETGKMAVHRARVPLDDLDPGRYVLRLAARYPAGGGEAARQIAFEVVP